MTASPHGLAKTSHGVYPAFSSLQSCQIPRAGDLLPSAYSFLLPRCCIASSCLNTDSTHFLLIPTLPARSLHLRSYSREVDRAGSGMLKGMWFRCVNTPAHRGKCRERVIFWEGRFRRGGSIHSGGAPMVGEDIWVEKWRTGLVTGSVAL